MVVGAGIFGVSLADHLAGSGWDVELVERHHPGHVRASSGGESRLIRSGHGRADWYTSLAWRARTLWRQIEADTGTDLMVESGVVWFGAGDGWVTDSAVTMARLGIPAERVEPGDLRSLFPSIDPTGIGVAVYEPRAGVLRAAKAVEVLANRAITRGARFTAATAVPEGRGVQVDGSRTGADVVVWACGPWLPALFPGLLEVRVTKQDIVHFGAGRRWAAPGVPGWIDFDASMYGCGDIDGKGFKAASDIEGPPFDPERGERVPAPESVRRARGYLARRFPELAEAPVVLTRTCQYTSTADGQWVIAPHPEHDGVWLLGGGSGHGFKHGPALAEYVARLIGGEEEPDPRFGLAPRSGGQSLRTLGAASGSS